MIKSISRIKREFVTYYTWMLLKSNHIYLQCVYVGFFSSLRLVLYHLQIQRERGGEEEKKKERRSGTVGERTKNVYP